MYHPVTCLLACPRSPWAAKLLAVSYCHMLFTLPKPIADIAHQNKAAVSDILFKAAAETLITIATDPEHPEVRVA